MFELRVDNNGYAWWYLDAISDDQQYALTIIAFIGSVFSPYYARARRKRASNPLQHCALNAIVYGKGAGRWAMTERSAKAVQQSAERLQIGPSHLSLSPSEAGHTLKIQIDEITAPIPKRLRGEISVSLTSISETAFSLDKHGRHQWVPMAPRCRVEVNLQQPNLQWQGNGYLDHNRGSEPVEDGFISWNWSRLNFDNGETVIIYDRTLHDQSVKNLMLLFDASGSLSEQQHGDAALRETDLIETRLAATSLWRMPRSIRCDHASQARIVRTLEDTPFYSRSEIEAVFGGQAARGIHESVSLTRFVKPIVQCMLPFRMPRRG